MARSLLSPGTDKRVRGWENKSCVRFFHPCSLGHGRTGASDTALAGVQLQYAVVKMRLFARVLCLEGHEQLAADATAAFHRLVEKVRARQWRPGSAVQHGQPSSWRLRGAVTGGILWVRAALVLLWRMLRARRRARAAC